MKKYNSKQQAYSNRIKTYAAEKRRWQLLAGLFSLVMILVGTFVVAAGGSIADMIERLASSGCMLALTLPPMVNIPRNDPMTAKPNSIKFRFYLARATDEVDIENFPKPINATLANFPLLPGKTWHYIDARTNTNLPNAASEGDVEPIMAFTFTADIPGMSKEMLNFLYGNNGGDFFVGWVNCITGEKFIAGSACSPLKMTVGRLGTDDAWNGASLSFATSCPDPFYYYDGDFTLAEPVAVAADATTFALSTNPRYQLGVNTAATALTGITNVTDADVNRIIDIIGGGGEFPTTITAGANFILQNGATWNGIAGSTISFEIMKTGDAAYTFIEVNRS